MGFNLLAFAGGAASAIEEKMDTAEKEAKTFAIASTKNMYEKYTKLIEENKTKAEEAAADMELIKSNYSSMADGKSFSAEQLAEIARSPNNRKFLVDAIKKGGINFGNLNPDQMVKIATSNNTPEVKREYIGQALALDTTLKTTLAEQRTKKQMGFFDQIGESAGRAAAEKAALALGTTTEQMKQALNEKPPVSTASFDFTGLRKEDTYESVKNRAQLAYIKANDTGTDDDKQKALTRLATVEAAGRTADAKDKTEEQIQTALINKITAEPDPKKKTLLTSELRTRQVLNKLPSDKEGGEKISQANLLTTALATLRTSQANSIPQGKYDVGANGEIILRDMELSESYRKGTTIGMNSVVALMTGPDGKPKSEMHKNALSVAGIRFNREGVAVVPELRVTDAQTPEPVAKPAIPAVPAKAAPAAGNIQSGSELQTRVEASGIKYEPAKYDYRVAPDGSIQRKAK